MLLFKRHEVIAQLLFSLDIPRFIFPYETYDGIGPNDPEFFDRYEAGRKEREEAATNFIENATDEVLWDLSETPSSLRSFTIKYSLSDPPPWYAGGFGVQIKKSRFCILGKNGFLDFRRNHLLKHWI